MLYLNDLQHNPTAQYLGDGVYATFDGYQLWLHTSNGLEITNTLALELTVFQSLLDYATQMFGPRA